MKIIRRWIRKDELRLQTKAQPIFSNPPQNDLQIIVIGASKPAMKKTTRFSTCCLNSRNKVFHISNFLPWGLATLATNIRKSHRRLIRVSVPNVANAQGIESKSFLQVCLKLSCATTTISIVLKLLRKHCSSCEIQLFFLLGLLV